ncbi:MAG TPA: portal protein [Candidatus Acidoferrum sp.]|nr:portal protein [Candidatus Acidoferrum sp.]
MAGASHKALFHKFRDETVIDRCRQYAQWTLPYLMADLCEVSTSGRVIVERDFQEVGALFTNNLSSKLTRILFPTQYPFFQASASAEFKKAIAQKGVSEDALRGMFSRLEMQANKRLFLNSGYAALILALKYLIVTGNVLLHRNSKDGTITTYGLQSFVTRRDGCGRLLDAILREFTVVEGLPEELQAALRNANRAKYGRPEQQVEKYTRIHKKVVNGRAGYEVSQEVDTFPIGESSWYPDNLCPWMAPTWVLIPGEHYGRGMVEDYAGGFARLSTLSESAALYGVEIMRVVHLVGAGAGADVDEIAGAESGEYVRGDAGNIAAHESGDSRKLEVVEAQLERVISRLAKAFMYQGATRDAERVTAYELQRDAQEAEYALGGTYSTLSGGIQVPMAHILMTEVSEEALTGLISGDLRPDVTAGIPALGRSSDVQNLLLAAQELGAVAPMAQLDKRIDPTRIMDMVLAGRSVDPTMLFYTPEQQKANAEADAAQQAAQMNLIKAGTLSDQGDQLAQTLSGA